MRSNVLPTMFTLRPTGSRKIV